MRINDSQRLILGPPGTGKTTTILNKIETLLGAGVKPERIAFVSFTRKAVMEAAGRACARFGLDRESFRYFRTIHSLCFQELGTARGAMIGRNDLISLGNMIGLRLTANFNMDEGAVLFINDEKGSKLLFLDNLARIMCVNNVEARNESGMDVPIDDLNDFSRKYRLFKESRSKLDFTDLLFEYIDTGAPIDVDYFFVDEAQDLSVAQWRVLQIAARRAKQVIICGDDDQSIFKWSGASLETFLALEGERTVLGQSYRLPQAVFSMAKDIISNVHDRFTKEFNPTGEIGEVKRVLTLNEANIEESESTLILVRNVYLLDDVYEYLQNNSLNFSGRGKHQGVNEDHLRAIVCWERLRKGEAISMDDARCCYAALHVGGVLARGGKAALERAEDTGDKLTFETLRDCYGLLDMPIWHKALDMIPGDKINYYISLLEKGKRLSERADVHANTIHGVKGGEADHVIILSDMARRTYLDMQRDRDSENRVAYVAVTRAKKRVTIVEPAGKFCFRY